MTINYYFGYGKNTNPQEMALRCPAATPIGAATLESHRFRFARHADIVTDHNFDVHGVLWNVTSECMNALDRLEGYPYYYDRKIVPVECKGVLRAAWVYYMQPGNEGALPSSHYWSTLHKGYRHFGVPPHQMMDAITPLLTGNRRHAILDFI